MKSQVFSQSFGTLYYWEEGMVMLSDVLILYGKREIRSCHDVNTSFVEVKSQCFFSFNDKGEEKEMKFCVLCFVSHMRKGRSYGVIARKILVISPCVIIKRGWVLIVKVFNFLEETSFRGLWEHRKSEDCKAKACHFLS